MPAADHFGVPGGFGATWGYQRRPPATRTDHDLEHEWPDGAFCLHRRCAVQLPYQCRPPIRPHGHMHLWVDSLSPIILSLVPGPTGCRPIPPSRRSRRTCVTLVIRQNGISPCHAALWGGSVRTAAPTLSDPRCSTLSGKMDAFSGRRNVGQRRCACGPCQHRVSTAFMLPLRKPSKSKETYLNPSDFKYSTTSRRN